MKNIFYMSLNKIFIILNIKYMSLNKIFIIFNIFRQNTMNKNNYKNNYKNIKKCKSKNWTASPLQPAKNCILRGYKPQVVMAFLCLIGTTTVECKSGYGLEAETEIKMLTVIQKAKRNLPIEIASTFLGAHSVPK